jgi:murein tripeptide amidase MpaA
MHVTSAFDGGNIELIEAGPDFAKLRITKDAGGVFLQWFYFRVAGVRGVPITLSIENAGETSYAAGWNGYRAVGSSDRNEWLRVPTEYDGRALTMRVTPPSDLFWLAYFAPYTMERHADLIARAQRHARVDVLGHSIEKQPIERVRIGDGPRVVWVIARQHPGETMAEWWMEGFLERLYERPALLSKAQLHIVPNMNPDGSCRGYLRTNAAGTNLNRAWLDPSERASPEVLCVRDAMHTTGVDLCLDVHGDEEIPYNFLAGPDGIPSLTPGQLQLVADFKRVWSEIDPELQTVHGYPPSAPGEADLRLCTNYVAEKFGCLAVTLEQPFKDNNDRPAPETGWSPARSKALGASAVAAIEAVVDRLR